MIRQSLVVLPFALLALVSGSSLAKEFHPNIIDGTPVLAADPEAKSTVGIIEDGIWVCSGTLVRKDLVITAAHCTLPGSSYGIRFSLNSKDASAPTIPVSQYFLPPGWDPARGGADIAVMLLSSDAPSGYVPVAAFHFGDDISHNDDSIIAGYGMSNANDPNSGGVLQKADVRVLHAADESEHFTMKQGPYGVCFGDSGGPAYFKVNGALVLGGVTEGVLNYQCKGKAWFTNVGYYRAWIESVAGPY